MGTVARKFSTKRKRSPVGAVDFEAEGQCISSTIKENKKRLYETKGIKRGVLTLQVPIVTNINFLLKISICCQEK